MGAAQHGDLVPQHEELGVLGGCRPAEQDQPAAQPREDEIEQAEGHARSSCPTTDLAPSRQLTGQADFWHPTGVFAAGDARYRSIKRVASAVGDGATAVRLVHEYLSAEGTAEPLLPARR